MGPERGAAESHCVTGGGRADGQRARPSARPGRPAGPAALRGPRPRSQSGRPLGQSGLRAAGQQQERPRSSPTGSLLLLLSAVGRGEAPRLLAAYQRRNSAAAVGRRGSLAGAPSPVGRRRY